VPSWPISTCSMQGRGFAVPKPQQIIAPGAARRYDPADGSSTRDGSRSVRGRVRSPHRAKLQAASEPTAYGSCPPRAAAPWDTDGSRYRLMPLYGGGIKRGIDSNQIFHNDKTTRHRSWFVLMTTQQFQHTAAIFKKTINRHTSTTV